MGGFSDHGGHLIAAAKAWPGAPKPWIDLSTGINPSAYPAPRASRAARARLPFLEEIVALEAAAGAAFGLDDPTGVVAIGGAEQGVRLLPQLLGVRTVCIPGPTYVSHGDAWTQAGARSVAQGEAGVVVMVNPNNPDGRTHQRAELLDLADRLQARDGWLVVDESFADVLDLPSLATSGHPRVIVLRSFGKFYGLAGLRLGFMLAPAELARRLRRRLGEWPVSADAIAAGLAAYPDTSWRERERERLKARADRLDRLLERAGVRIVGGTPLFRLAQAEGAGQWFARLAAAGILTRPFDDAPTWLRLGLPRSRDWARLGAALGQTP